MRTPKATSFLLSALLILPTAGCYGYFSVAPATPTTYDKVHVALHSGEVVALDDATVDSLAVTGVDPENGSEVEVAMEDVDRVYARQVDKLGAATIGLTGLTVVALVIAAMSANFFGGS